jgi:hypothetical protein
MMYDTDTVVLRATLAMIRRDYEVQTNNSEQTNDSDQHTCGICAYCFAQGLQNVQGCSQPGPQEQKDTLINVCWAVITHSAAMNYAFILTVTTMDKKWIPLFNTETKCQKHAELLTTKMITIFYDADGTMLTHSVSKGTINRKATCQYYERSYLQFCCKNVDAL